MRSLWLAFAVLLPVVVFDGGSPASAIPTIEYFGEEYAMTAARFPSQLCVGEKKTITVWVKKYGLYRRSGQQVRVRRPRIYRVDRGTTDLGLARVTYEIDNHAVLDETSSDLTLDTVLWFRLTVQAKKAGTATVNFNAQSPGVMGAGQSVTVRVRECDYDVHVFSIWHLNIGRNIVASSSIDTVITGVGHPAGSIYNDKAEAKNIAVSFTPPCQAVYKLPPTKAGVFAKLHDEKLDVEIDYSPNTVGTGVTCGPLSGEANDPETLDPITFYMTASGGSADWPHVLHAPGVGDFTGTTYITVIPKPR